MSEPIYKIPSNRTCDIESCVERYGAQTMSMQVFAPGISHWRAEVEGQLAVAGYVDAFGHRVVAGGPICPPDLMGEAVFALQKEAAESGLKTCFFGAEPALVDALAGTDASFDALPLGMQPEWDPRSWTLDGPRRRNLRYQLARARRKGVSVQPVSHQQLQPGRPFRAACERVLASWLRSRSMAPMHFVAGPWPFHEAHQRQILVAIEERASGSPRVACVRSGPSPRVVGFLSMLRVPAKNGWFFEHVIRDPHAPNGTAELLVEAALRWAGARGASFATTGMAPLAGVSSQSLPLWARWAFQFSYRHLGRLYNFSGLYRFKSKFVPDRWMPLCLVGEKLSPMALVATLSAFTAGRPLHFATHSLAQVGAASVKELLPQWRSS
jgi:phosphatidylglycerol lysyltransferase